VHLVLGKEPQGGRATSEYEEAASVLSSWREEGVLVREGMPCLYVLEETFSYRGQECVRRGLLCALLLEEFSAGTVVPHEQTLPGHKADRLRLMTACRANLSPVFGVLSDPSGLVERALLAAVCDDVLYEFRSPDEIVYRLMRVTDDSTMAALGAAVSRDTAVIADGHHRYETALTYRAEHRGNEGLPGASPADFVLFLGVSSRDPGLRVLPTHRLVKAEGAFDGDWLAAALGDSFDLQEQHVPTSEDLQSIVAQWGTGTPIIGCYLPGGRLLLLDTEGHRLPASALPAQAADLPALPVVLLEYGIVQALFNLPVESRTDVRRLRYEPDIDRLFWDVESGRFDAGLLLPPIAPAVLAQVATAGQKLPPKTSYFYPKVPSGLVIYPYENQAFLPRIVTS
jgi:uncharacterized protein (DUF1015 family)